MTEREFDMNSFHNDPDLFSAALADTEAASGFTARLIEKDYFCSLVLGLLYNKIDLPLVFKGGTCLSKVYTDFYRLSEDLDFIIPMETDSKQTARRSRIKPVKQRLPQLRDEIPSLQLVSPLNGHNQSTHYAAHLAYQSAVTGRQESIKIEIGLREPLLRAVQSRAAHTLIVSGLTRRPVIPPFDVVVMDIQEAYAEKCRAALTRKEPAIRDIFDIDHGMKQLGIDMFSPEFMSMVKEKLAIPGNDQIDTAANRKEMLLRQLDTELRPVLRRSDFDQFDLETAFEAVYRLAQTIRS